MKVYEVMARELRGLGVDTIFGLLGDANIHCLVDFQERGGRYVPTVHEAGAVSAAAVYARVSGRAGVASVTQGPGFTNTISALIEAVKSDSPMLLVTGEQLDEPTDLQYLEVRAFCDAAAAGYERVHSASSALRDLRRAWRRVVAEQRPIVLSLPAGVGMAEAGERLLGHDAEPGSLDLSARAVPTAPPVELDAALELILAAERPLILAGRGAVAAGAHDALTRLGESLGAAYANTLHSKGLFSDSARNLGSFGGLSHPASMAVIAEADCLLVFGASLNEFTTLKGELVAGKTIVQVDLDPRRFGWYVTPHEALCGDAHDVASRLAARVQSRGHDPARAWADHVTRALATSERYVARATKPGTVDAAAAMIELNRLLPAERIFVSDGGRFVYATWPHLEVSRPDHWQTTVAFGSIGFGLTGAIGAALARPDALTVAVMGDGGFMMHMSDLWTVAHERLKVLVVVLNDGAYGAEHAKLTKTGMDTKHSLKPWPGFESLAHAMGMAAITVRELPDLQAVDPMLDGPCLVDVRLDPDDMARYFLFGRQQNEQAGFAATPAPALVAPT